MKKIKLIACSLILIMFFINIMPIVSFANNLDNEINMVKDSLDSFSNSNTTINENNDSEKNVEEDNLLIDNKGNKNVINHEAQNNEEKTNEELSKNVEEDKVIETKNINDAVEENINVLQENVNIVNSVNVNSEIKEDLQKSEETIEKNTKELTEKKENNIKYVEESIEEKTEENIGENTDENIGENIQENENENEENGEEENVIIPKLEYTTHVQNIGWTNKVGENEISGTTGRSKNVEAITINFKEKINSEANIKYKTHVQDIGWQTWKQNGEIAGTTGKSKRIEAIQIKLENIEGYSIEYRVHISGIGWQKWKNNGQMAGTVGQSRGIEAIQIRIIPSGQEIYEPEISYATHVQDIGWQNEKSEGLLSGTSGQAKRLEAIKINMQNMSQGAKIKYQVHIQDYGWQGWKQNGEIAGTSGQSKRLEAIRIILEGLEGYTVEYQVHIQDYGWSAWMIDGEMAGTAGKAKRLEAIRIRIVPKYYKTQKGIDVSEFNGQINWNEVKKSGIDFAMVRCAYRGYGTGRIVEDSLCRSNITGAIESGVKVGLYFFSQAISVDEGIEEANFALNIARNYNITYPIVIDSEWSSAPNNSGRADGLNKTDRTNIIEAFCNQILNNGYTPMIYASRNWFYDNLQYDKLAKFKIWLAHYTGSSEKKSDFKYDYDMWQYTSSGLVSGINGSVDMDIEYK